MYNMYKLISALSKIMQQALFLHFLLGFPRESILSSTYSIVSFKETSNRNLPELFKKDPFRSSPYHSGSVPNKPLRSFLAVCQVSWSFSQGLLSQYHDVGDR